MSCGGVPEPVARNWVSPIETAWSADRPPAGGGVVAVLTHADESGGGVGGRGVGRGDACGPQAQASRHASERMQQIEPRSPTSWIMGEPGEIGIFDRPAALD
jgi:hypothetical protein